VANPRLYSSGSRKSPWQSTSVVPERVVLKNPAPQRPIMFLMFGLVSIYAWVFAVSRLFVLGTTGTLPNGSDLT